MSNIQTVTRKGETVLREQIGSEKCRYVTYTPPIPRDRKEFLNGDCTSTKEQLWFPSKKMRRDGWERTPGCALPAFADKTPNQLKRWYDTLGVTERRQLLHVENTRRKEGCWFYNNGTPTYISANNYFYLTYYHLDIGLPNFRDADRRMWMVWRHILQQPRAFGIDYRTRRRRGKSYSMGSVGLEAATRIVEMHVGLQSKTEKDAKSRYKEACMKPWQKLAPWYHPRHAGSSRPVTMLEFSAAANNDPLLAHLESLESWIGWRSSVETAWDSEGLGIFLHDEYGKNQRYNSWDRHNVVKRMMVQEGEVQGRIFGTTTTAETDHEDDKEASGKVNRNGYAMAKKFWETSDHTKLDLDDPWAQTESGLWRFFQPAYEGFLMDQYGNDLIDESKKYYLRERALKANDPVALLGEKRANPFDEDEMLLPDASECEFNAKVILDTIKIIEDLSTPPVAPYNFIQIGHDPNTGCPRVAATPDDAGRWLLVPQAIPHPDHQNSIYKAGLVANSKGDLIPAYAPRNANRYEIVGDPYDKGKKEVVREDQASSGAMHILWKPDPANETLEMRRRPKHWPSGGYIGEYLARHEYSDSYKNDALLAAIFWGCKTLPERNKGDWSAYFRLKGFGAFIANAPYGTEGISEVSRLKGGVYTGETTNADRDRKLAQYFDSELGPDWRMMPLLRTLYNALRFKASARTAYDLTSSASLGALVLVGSPVVARIDTGEMTLEDLLSMLPT